MNLPKACVLLFVLAFAHSLVQAQWTIVDLHVEGAERSFAVTVKDGRQMGSAMFDGNWHAVMWEGTASSWVDLHPSQFSESYGSGLDGENQTGAVYASEHLYTASIWSGSAQSYVSLHPAGAKTSVVGEAEDGQQVGGTQESFGSDFRAALWTGTAASYVSLHPPGALYSNAGSVRNGRQGGYASFGSGTRAGFWTGTSGSFVSIHPQGYDYSEVHDISEDQQVGFVFDTFGGGRSAAVWNDTAESFVNLYPTAFSTATGVDEGTQVGSVWISGLSRAVLWRGTAGSIVDLAQFLPFESLHSEANDVWVNGNRAYIVGSAQDAKSKVSKAVMWVSQEVAPTSFSMVRGSVFSGNLASLQNSDNGRLVMRPGFVFSVGEPPVQVRLNASAPTASPNGFSFSVESSASFGNAQQKVWLWNYVLGDYEALDTRLATTTDDVVTVTVRTNPSRFIEPGTLAIRALVSCRAIGPAFAYPWSGRIDKVWWTFPG